MRVNRILVGSTFMCLTLLNPMPAKAVRAVYDAGANAKLATVNGAVAAANTQLGVLTTYTNSLGAQIEKSIKTTEENGRALRDFLTQSEHHARIEEARQDHVVPASICSETLTAGAINAETTRSSIQTSQRMGAVVSRGGTGSSGSTRTAFTIQSIGNVLTKVNATESDSNLLVQQAHSEFCDGEDFAAYGETEACPRISTTMPGGDTRFSSIISGARPDNQPQADTFTDPQIEAAQLYIHNAYNKRVSPNITSEQTKTPQGKQYIGVKTKFDAMMSASRDPAQSKLAKMTPNPTTKPLIEQARQSQYADLYFERNASDEARRTGIMSSYEYQRFDVLRRTDPEYSADLASMSGENLIREQIRLQIQNNALLLEQNEKLDKIAMINGVSVASIARQEFKQPLESLYKSATLQAGD